MARNGSDDVRRGTAGAEVVEALLAYAQTQSRRKAQESAEQAIAMSRALAARDPATYTVLLVRALRTAAILLGRRRRPLEALPLAEEAAALARGLGGAPLVVSLSCLAEIYTALGRYGEAASAAEEAGRAPPDLPP